MKNLSVLRLVNMAAVAAVYAVLTVAISPLAYGDLQFRFSEILVLLCFYNKDYIISLALGTAIANLFSPFALIDVPFGTLATILAVICIWKSKNIYLAAIFPVLFNGIIVGGELAFEYGMPYWWAAVSVAVGEAGVMCVGVIVFRTVLQRNSMFMKLIDNQKA